MDRAQKETIVSEIRDKFSEAEITVLTGFKGLDVASLMKIRRSLRDKSVDYRVVKNTLAKIAVRGTPAEDLTDEFEGPVGVAFGYGDPTVPPRILVNFMKTNKNLTLKVAFFSGEKIGIDKIRALASLPSKDEMLTQVAGLFAAPIRGMVTCLVGVPRGFINCLVALRGQKEKTNQN